MTYDENNVFAKIIRKEIPCELVSENASAIAFNDIEPRAPIHVLIIPKKNYSNYHDFAANATQKEIIDLHNLITRIIEEKKLKNSGYRLITNSGSDGNQEVKHLHFHLLGGQNLGPMIR